jgi:hypothetical protein
VKNVFEAVHHLLNEKGFFIIQTIHPLAVVSENYGYQDGWKDGSWEGFNDEFTNPPPWYFRTLNSWKNLFKKQEINLIEIVEPKFSTTQNFASIIFVGQVVNASSDVFLSDQ